VTLFTSTIELHAVMEDLKAVTLGNSILEGLERLVFKFNNLSTIKADEVIMVSPFGGGFVPGFSISKFPLGRHAEAGEKL
jgi:hypothetical protein